MLINNENYFEILENVKAQIQNAQYKAVLGANRELILLYWNIGNVIIENSVWGNKFIDNLARDIKLEFPNAKGYSVRNLKYMRKFAALFPEVEIVQAALAQLTWYHLQLLMDKISDKAMYLWYADKALENGWSRNVLMHQVSIKLFERQAIADKATNFEQTLPSAQSELAQDSLLSAINII